MKCGCWFLGAARCRRTVAGAPVCDSMVWRAAERTPDSVSWRACGSTMTARKPTANLTLIRRGRLLPPPLFLAPQPRPPPRPPPGHAAGTAPIPTQTVTPDKRFHVVEPRAPEALTGSFVVRMFVPPPRATLPRTRRRADRQTDRRRPNFPDQDRRTDRRREITSGGYPLPHTVCRRMCFFLG